MRLSDGLLCLVVCLRITSGEELLDDGEPTCADSGTCIVEPPPELEQPLGPDRATRDQVARSITVLATTPRFLALPRRGLQY